MSGDDQFNEMIIRLYDAAMGTSSWDGVAAQLAGLFDAGSCAVQTRFINQRAPDIQSVTPNILPALGLYASHYCHIDEWAIRCQRNLLNSVVGSDDLISDRELEMTEFYNEWLRKVQNHYALGTVFSLMDNSGVGVIGVHHTKSEGLFEKGHRRKMTLLLPHLQRALSLRARLGRLELAERTSLETLAHLESGAIVVEADGRIVYASPLAEEILRNIPALAMTAGRLRIDNSDKGPLLAAAIKAAAEIGRSKPGMDDTLPSRNLFAIPDPAAGRLCILVAPLPRLAGTNGQGRALILLSLDGATSGSFIHTLVALYGLTPSEARVASSLIAGETLQDYANRTQHSMNTVKVQLKSVFAKCGCGRQSDLIRDVLGNPLIRAAARPKNGRNRYDLTI